MSMSDENQKCCQKSKKPKIDPGCAGAEVFSKLFIYCFFEYGRMDVDRMH